MRLVRERQAAGLILTGAQAEAIRRAGDTDLVAIGRQALYDPIGPITPQTSSTVRWVLGLADAVRVVVGKREQVLAAIIGRHQW